MPAGVLGDLVEPTGRVREQLDGIPADGQHLAIVSKDRARVHGSVLAPRAPGPYPLTGGRPAVCARYFCPAGSACDWLVGPLAVCRFQSRQTSRCTGIHLGMSRKPGMNGMHSSKMVAAPVM